MSVGGMPPNCVGAVGPDAMKSPALWGAFSPKGLLCFQGTTAQIQPQSEKNLSPPKRHRGSQGCPGPIPGSNRQRTLGCGGDQAGAGPLSHRHPGVPGTQPRTLWVRWVTLAVQDFRFGARRPTPVGSLRSRW